MVKKPKVLILDEDLLALELYARELSENYWVQTISDVAEAKKKLREEFFDILVMEPAVNGDEGWGLLNEVKSLQSPPSIILCSVEDDRKEGLENGAQAFLVKPVLPASLHQVLDQTITRKTSKLE